MATLFEIEMNLIKRLAEEAHSPQSGFDISGNRICTLMSDVTGPALISDFITSFVQKGYLQQTHAIDDDDDYGRYQIKRALVEAYEKIERAAEEKPEQNRSEHAKQLKFSDFCNQLLMALAKNEELEGPGYYDPGDVAEKYSVSYRSGWLRKAATYYRDYGYVDAAFTIGGGEDGGLDVSLTALGLEKAEELESEAISSENSSSGAYVNIDLQSLGEDVWEPLPVEVSEEERNAIADELESVREDVRASNGYAATHPEEQKSIVWTLGAAVNAFREGLFTRLVVEYCLVRPLRRLIEVFKDAPLQFTAQKILEWIYMKFIDFISMGSF